MPIRKLICFKTELSRQLCWKCWLFNLSAQTLLIRITTEGKFIPIYTHVKWKIHVSPFGIKKQPPSPPPRPPRFFNYTMWAVLNSSSYFFSWDKIILVFFPLFPLSWLLDTFGSQPLPLWALSIWVIPALFGLSGFSWVFGSHCPHSWSVILSFHSPTSSLSLPFLFLFLIPSLFLLLSSN